MADPIHVFGTKILDLELEMIAGGKGLTPLEPHAHFCGTEYLELMWGRF